MKDVEPGMPLRRHLNNVKVGGSLGTNKNTKAYNNYLGEQKANLKYAHAVMIGLNRHLKSIEQREIKLMPENAIPILYETEDGGLSFPERVSVNLARLEKEVELGLWKWEDLMRATSVENMFNGDQGPSAWLMCTLVLKGSCLAWAKREVAWNSGVRDMNVILQNQQTYMQKKEGSGTSSSSSSSSSSNSNIDIGQVYDQVRTFLTLTE